MQAIAAGPDGLLYIATQPAQSDDFQVLAFNPTSAPLTTQPIDDTLPPAQAPPTVTLQAGDVAVVWEIAGGDKIGCVGVDANDVLYFGDNSQGVLRIANASRAGGALAFAAITIPHGHSAQVMPDPTAPTGTAAASGLGGPRGIALGTAGDLFVADQVDFGTGDTPISRVLHLDPNGRVLEVVAGTGAPGFAGDGGDARIARLNGVEDIAADAQGNVWVVDGFNGRIRVLNRGPDDLALGSVRIAPGGIDTIAGSGAAGAAPTVEGALRSVALAGPRSIALDPRGVAYVGCRTGEVLALNAGAVDVAIAAGTVVVPRGALRVIVPASAGLGSVRVALDERGGLALLDEGHGRVFFLNAGDAPRTLAAGTAAPGGPIVQVAGTGLGVNPRAPLGDGGDALAARFGGQLRGSLAGDLLVVSDGLNARLRLVNIGAAAQALGPSFPAVPAGGITKLAGSGAGDAPTLDATAAGAAIFETPGGLARDPLGRVLFTDETAGVVYLLNGAAVASALGGRLIAPGGVAVFAGEISGGRRLVLADGLHAGRGRGDLLFTDSALIVRPGQRVYRIEGSDRSRAPLVGGAVLGAASTIPRRFELGLPLDVFPLTEKLLLIADAGASFLRCANLGATPATVAGVTVSADSVVEVAGTGSAPALDCPGGPATCSYDPPRDLELPGTAGLPAGLRHNMGPLSVAALSPDLLFVADAAQACVWRVSAASATIVVTATSLAGVPVEFPAGHEAPFKYVLASGTPAAPVLFVAVAGTTTKGRPAHQVLRVTFDAGGNPVPQVIVNTRGFQAFNGHLGPAATMVLNTPTWLALDRNGEPSDRRSGQ